MTNNDAKKTVATAHQRYQQALAAGRDELFRLVLDPDLGFIALLLGHPKLDETHLLTLLKRRDLNESLVATVYRHCKKKKVGHRLIFALVKNPAASGSLVRTLLPLLRLFELADLCKLPGISPETRVAAERAITQRLPTTPLGNKITLARKGTAAILGELLRDGQPQVFEACLNNPQLKEASVFQFLRSAASGAETISQIARHPRWKERPNLKIAILKNNRTPAIWFTLWLPKLNLQVIRQLQMTHRANPAKKQLIETELKKRKAL
jgi:hypothetical protein